MTASEEQECVAPLLNWIDNKPGAFFSPVFEKKTALGNRVTIYRSVFWNIRGWATPAGRWGRAFMSSLNFMVNLECLSGTAIRILVSQLERTLSILGKHEHLCRNKPFYDSPVDVSPICSPPECTPHKLHTNSRSASCLSCIGKTEHACKREATELDGSKTSLAKLVDREVPCLVVIELDLAFRY